MPRMIQVACATFAFLICSGCRPDATGSPSTAQRMTVTINRAQERQPDSTSSARPSQIEQAIQADPGAVRLQEISGALLEYYALHGRLPTTLEALQSLPDLDQPLNFVSPSSGKPYVYVAAGLSSPADNRQLVVYDAAPDAAGLRYVILLRHPHAREAAATWVDRLTDAAFRQYGR